MFFDDLRTLGLCLLPLWEVGGAYNGFDGLRRLGLLSTNLWGYFPYSGRSLEIQYIGLVKILQ